MHRLVGLGVILVIPIVPLAAVAQTSATLTAAPPQSSTTTTPAPSPLAVLGVTGGANSAGSGTAGQGSSPSVLTGNGGDATGTGSPTTIGGAGGSFTVSTGNGGASGSGATAAGANGGDMLFNFGIAGSYGGTGPAGRGGALLMSRPGVPTAQQGGDIGDPLLCGPASTGICLYWLYNSSLTLYNVLAWRDVTTTGNAVSAGLDDQGMRLVNTGAIRFGGTSLTSALNNGCLTSDGAGAGTLSIDYDPLNSYQCNMKGHGGNLKLTNLISYGVGSFAGAGSSATIPVFTVTGAPTASSGAVPQTYLNAGGGTPSFSAPGTMFGMNAPSGFTGNLEDDYVNGVGSVFTVSYQGAITTGTIPLSSVTNPTADTTFTFPNSSVNGLTLAGNPPAALSTNGTAATTLFNVSPVSGGATTSTGSNTGGTGSSPTISAGTGGAATGIGTTSTVGGTGGAVTLTAGNGGAGTAGNDSGGVGGNIVLTPGTGGTASGSGTAGVPGQIQLNGAATPGASEASVLVNGAPYTVGTGTTNFPMVALWTSGAAAPTWNASGTMLGINAPSGFGGSFFEAHNNGFSALFTMDTTGYLSLSTGVRGNASATAVSYIGGRDVTTTSPGGATLRGGDVTGGTTASLTPGSTTVRGGDNASTGGTETGGAATLRGGDDTGASGNSNTGGAVTIRGGNVTSTGTSLTPGTVSVTGGGLTGAATNIAGADVTVGGGLGTGNATPAHVWLRTPGMNPTSGTTAQVTATNYVVHKKLDTSRSGMPVTMFNIAMASGQTIGGEVSVHVEALEGTTDNCSTQQAAYFAGENTNGTFGTTNIQAIGTAATICKSGTLTISITASSANPVVFSVTPSWTIAPTSVIITVEIHNLSQQDITLL